MMQNVTEAIEEVNLIKKVIDRTQNDFSYRLPFRTRARWAGRTQQKKSRHPALFSFIPSP